MKINAFLGAVFLVAMTLGSTSHAKSYDVMNLPAVHSELASKSLIYSIAKYGERHYATGQFGHILYSDDDGQSWTQAEVPVRSGILDIHFPSPENGWAVGHEGIILHSSDGGKTWVKRARPTTKNWRKMNPTTIFIPTLLRKWNLQLGRERTSHFSRCFS
jgi:photosystem II stability/assembly factor-like uncharacterized protein